MEFGRVPEAALNSINFALPEEPLFNQLVLKGTAAKKPAIYLGCAKWGRTEWVGKIYPPKTKEKDFLDHYVKHYNSIELNATHYKIYGPAGIARWAAKAADKDFLFCPKMYQGITHRGSLLNKDFITTEFLRGIIAFEKKLGPVFIQVSDAFGSRRKDELFQFLRSLPADLSFFLEVRHPDWFGKAAIRDELLEFLRSVNMGIVITDTSGRRDCAHMHLTVPKTFIRYVGNSLHPTDYTRVDEWVIRMKYWLDKGLEELYFFMHMHDETFSPELTVYLVDKLNSACGTSLIKPKFIDSPQGDLFGGH
ncbi:MAG: hypothetical protein RLZZ28_2098 [Bacteroidota bacterium]|jgi:uncharacterized protein YecE (DUF72 family)